MLIEVIRLKSTSGNSERTIKKVVVKQSGPAYDGPTWLAEEARYLKALGSSGTDHIVKLYKEDCFLETGLGSSDLFDPLGEKVGRIFLEFCEGGDFTAFLKDVYEYVSCWNV